MKRLSDISNRYHLAEWGVLAEVAFLTYFCNLSHQPLIMLLITIAGLVVLKMIKIWIIPNTKRFIKKAKKNHVTPSRMTLVFYFFQAVFTALLSAVVIILPVIAILLLFYDLCVKYL